MRKNAVLSTIAGPVLATILGGGISGVRAATPLYQWNFDNSGTPTLSAGGGALSITNSTHGSSTFAAAGVTGAAGDLAYDGSGATPNQYNTSDPAGIASTSSANVLTGLGTLSQFTVTMWIKNTAGLPTATNARLMMLGGSSSYDEGSGNGFALAFNSGGTLQVDVGGTTNVNPSIGNNINTTLTSAYGASSLNGWVFVAFAYDGAASNVFFDSTIQAATGNTDSNNSYAYVDVPGQTPTLLSTTAIQSGNASVGSVAFGSADYAFVGNRSSLNRGFVGQIDDVRVYSGILASSDLSNVVANADLLATAPEPAMLSALALVGCGTLISRRRVAR